MGITKTLGGDRIGSGNKMKVHMHGYERSTFDLGYLWRSTMSAGTIVPFLSEITLTGDTWDINLDCDIKTHPTLGPLFASFKVQLDVYWTPLRIYNSYLHNNKVGIGMQMDKVFFPVMKFNVPQFDITNLRDTGKDYDNSQINPSCILKYLGLSGFGWQDYDPSVQKDINATSYINYWEVVKDYYSNKQEGIGCVIHNGADAGGNVSAVWVNGNPLPNPAGLYMGSGSDTIKLEEQTPGTPPNLEYWIFITSEGEIYANDLATWTYDNVTNDWLGQFKASKWGQLDVFDYRIAGAQDSKPVAPRLETFPLANIDGLREELLSYRSLTTPFDIFQVGNAPYDLIIDNAARMSSQEGLAVKTYQADMFNTWVNTEYITGPTGINAITAIDTTSGSFNIETLIMARKVYDVMMRIAVSGGTYQDWLEAVSGEELSWRPETPVYMGGLIKELVFQEVISNAAATGQDLGTLGGRGILSKKHKGGNIVVKSNEPGILLGVISLTPRIDYSQGNKWHMTDLETWDDLHKPGMDGLGYQDLTTQKLAWWDSYWNNTTSEWVTFSAGKQPAWINYQSNVNRTYGNFAIETEEMFMTLNRRYEMGAPSSGSYIDDLTTYIDPSKFNFIFAQQSLDAQNFWAQIAVNMTVRRKMSSKVMPNL